MAQWFYSEGPNRNVGPLTEPEIGDAFRRGLLTLETPLWREGMAQWQALRSVAAELGLLGVVSAPAPAAGGPPPLSYSQMQGTRPAYAAGARPAPVPTGMSRGMVILLVCVIGGFALLVIMSILAAIALPAYADYTARAKLMQASQSMAELRPAIQAQWAQGRCPSNDSPGFQSPEGYANQFVDSVTIGRFEDGSCGMELRVRGIRKQFDGKAVWWSLAEQSQQWSCSSEIEDRYLPVECRE